MRFGHKYLIVTILLFQTTGLFATEPHNNWRFSVAGNFIYNRNSGTHNPDMAIMPIFSIDLGISRHSGYETNISEAETSFRLGLSFVSSKLDWTGIGKFYKHGIYFAPYFSIPLYTFKTKANQLAFNWYPGIHVVYSFYNTSDVPRDYLPKNSYNARIAGGLGFEYNLKLKNNNFFRISVAQSIMQLFPKYMEGTYAPFSIQMGYAIRLGKQEQKTKP